MDQKSLKITNDTLLKHSQFIKSLAKTLVAGEIEAEDLEQETILRALESNGPKKRDSIKAWLSSIAKNFLKNKRKRLKLEKEKIGFLIQRETPSPEEIALRNEQIAKVAEAVISLPRLYQVVVYLRYYKGLSPKEIAKELSIPYGTAKSRLKTALKLLRRELDKRNEGKRDLWVKALAFIVMDSNKKLPAKILAFKKIAVVLCLLIFIGISNFLFINNQIEVGDNSLENKLRNTISYNYSKRILKRSKVKRTKVIKEKEQFFKDKLEFPVLVINEDNNKPVPFAKVYVLDPTKTKDPHNTLFRITRSSDDLGVLAKNNGIKFTTDSEGMLYIPIFNYLCSKRKCIWFFKIGFNC